MDDKLATEVALFRFSLISSLLNHTHTGSQQDYLESICTKSYPVPGHGPREFSPMTLKRWLWQYRQRGVEGLKPQPRADRGLPRRLSGELVLYIRERLTQNPRLTASALYRELIGNGSLGIPPASLSTFSRFFRRLEETDLRPPVEERRRFGFEFANDCWQTDVCVGPYLKLDGKKKRTYLIAFLDDASRVVPHGEFFLEDNLLRLQTVLKKAILKRGIPKMIYTDQGKIFTSQQLGLICAHLGVTLAHATPYTPEAKGKIERAFRTIRMQFMDLLLLDEIDSLAELNQRFWAYLEGSYHRSIHATLRTTPLERYLTDQDKLRFPRSQQDLDWVFLHEADRRVNKDATVSVQNHIYELPTSYIGRQVKLRFNPENTDMIYLDQGDPKKLLPVYLVRPLDNAKLPREKNPKDSIDYDALYGGGIPK